MAENRKQELILDGLSCTQCSDQIARAIGNLDGVAGASVSFTDKLLLIDIEDSKDVETVLESSRRIVKEIEPQVVITEKGFEKPQRKVFLMMGLCCDDCALKIEKSIQEITGVKNAVVDFGKQELRLELEHEKLLPQILAESRKRARRVVRGIRVRSAEDADGTRKRLKLVALAAGLPLFVLGLLELVPGAAPYLFLASYLFFGASVLWRALKNILRGKIFNENFLMTVATVGAFAIGAFPEAAAVMLFYKIGMSLEDLAVERSRRSIRSVFALRPDYANRQTETGTEIVRPEEIAIGESIVVKPGERVPLDGVVFEGNALVDTHLVSGESVPVQKTAGDGIVSGSIVTNSPLTIMVEKKLADSLVTRIADYVEQAARKKSKAEHYLTVFTRYYTPLVVGAALLLALLPPLLIPGEMWSVWLYRALIFLVISCPCALVLSIPLSFSAGIGSLARSGVLVKGAQYVEALRRVDTCVFDKTGTLTEGVFEVSLVDARAPFTQADVLAFAALAEGYSGHPAAAAVRRAYGGHVELERISAYDEIAGLGVKATVDGKEVLAGNARLLEREGVLVPVRGEGGTIVHVAVDRTYAGAILIADRIRPSARQAVNELAALGVRRTVMLSGDVRAHAEAIARELSINEVHAPLLPEEKVLRFDELKEREPAGRTILCVGDGINDAPLLARADIGAAMGGSGRDAAIESADLVLMDDDLTKLPLAVKIARRTHRIVVQNIVLAFAVKALVLALGAFGVATMWEAVFADVGVALLALANALRLLRKGRSRLTSV